jgi:predicted amidophosphoribosyltransferase
VNTFQELLDLLLPCRCIRCGTVGAVLCNECNPPQTLRAVDRFQIRGWSVTDYGPVEKTIIESFKESGITALAAVLAKQMRSGLDALCHQQQTSLDGSVLVPAPSSRANYRLRGYLPTLVLAKALRREAEVDLHVLPALTFSRDVSDQASLTAEQRMANLSGSMVAKGSVGGQRIILIDDVVTTGATLLEAARAVTAAGGEVLGFLTFSETIRKTPAKS